MLSSTYFRGRRKGISILVLLQSMGLCLFPLLLSFFVVTDALDIGTGGSVDVMTRDIEALPSPVSFGHKYMTGGAGEGEQRLTEDGEFQARQQVKSDNVLPAYCEPPNPCPVGYSGVDGCLEEFENTADFSRDYQAQQQCICDEEHMFNCANKETSNAEENLHELLDDNLHQTMIAKKFHDKRSYEDMEPRRKRSIPEPHKVNPFLQGEPLHTVQKKNGRHAW